MGTLLGSVYNYPKSIERIYIFPKEICIDSIGISKYVLRLIPWFDIYRVNDEKILEEVNDIWKQIFEKKKKRIEVLQ